MAVREDIEGKILREKSAIDGMLLELSRICYEASRHEGKDNLSIRHNMLICERTLYYMKRQLDRLVRDYIGEPEKQ